MPIKISLWDKYSDDHWLRAYGRTQVIVIDDQWHSDSTFGIPSMNRKALEKKYNIAFHYFKPPEKGKEWDNEWFMAELNRTKNECENPCVILLDLMYGPETDTIRGSGKRFLKILSDDKELSEIPILIITAGKEDRTLLEELKSEGGSLQDFLGKYYPAEEPFSDRFEASFLEYALLSDPNIHAYSYKMRKVAQSIRKVVLDPEMIEKIKGKDIPRSVLFIGHSGDGKNYLADYLQSISDRRQGPFEIMSFSDISDPSNAEPKLFGSLVYTGFTGNPTRLNSRTGQINHGGDLRLATVGMVTNADNGTLLIDELGNSPSEMQTKLLRFLDRREISPHLHSGYIPIDRPYNIWALMTMQPQHSEKLPDLKRRLNKMIKIYVPPLKERSDDVVPMALSVIDSSMAESAKSVFTEDAIIWLKSKLIDITAGNLTSIVSNLLLESSRRPYNTKELKRAFNRLDDKENERLTHQSDINNETPLKPSVLPWPVAEDISKKNEGFEENKLPSIIHESNRNIVGYILNALESNKDKRNGEPNYPQTWFAMTGEDIKTSSLCQRNIGNYIFQLSDEEIVRLMKQSKVFEKAVFQCGSKVHSAKKRLEGIANKK